MMEVQSQYDALYDKQITYCDAVEMVDTDHSDDLNDLVIVCAVFIGIGALVQCCTACCTFAMSKQILDGEIDLNNPGDLIATAASQLLLAFGLGLLEDVPQTIV